MKRAVKCASTVDLLEKCSLVDIDQEKCSVVEVDRRRLTFLKYFWHKNVDVNQQKTQDGRRQWLTAGSPFHLTLRVLLLL